MRCYRNLFILFCFAYCCEEHKWGRVLLWNPLHHCCLLPTPLRRPLIHDVQNCAVRDVIHPRLQPVRECVPHEGTATRCLCCTRIDYFSSHYIWRGMLQDGVLQRQTEFMNSSLGPPTAMPT